MKRKITIALSAVNKAKIYRIFGGIVAFIEATLAVIEVNPYVKNKILKEVKNRSKNEKSA